VLGCGLCGGSVWWGLLAGLLCCLVGFELVALPLFVVWGCIVGGGDFNIGVTYVLTTL